MAARPEGVYRDGRGGWYFKVSVGRDPLTGRRTQITRRGFATAAAAGRARREAVGKVDGGVLRPSSSVLTVNELLDLYLDGLDADGRLSAKTRFDYRHNAQSYVRPLLGARKVRDVTPDVVVAWQRALAKGGGTKNGKPLGANTIRLARSPLSGAFKLALTIGVVAVNPVASVPRPRAPRSVPRHWIARPWSTSSSLAFFASPDGKARTTDVVTADLDSRTIDARLRFSSRNYFVRSVEDWLDPKTLLVKTADHLLAWRPDAGRVFRVTDMVRAGQNSYSTVSVAIGLG